MQLAKPVTMAELEAVLAAPRSQAPARTAANDAMWKDAIDLTNAELIALMVNNFAATPEQIECAERLWACTDELDRLQEVINRYDEAVRRLEGR